MSGTFDNRWRMLVNNGVVYAGSGDPEFGELCAIDARTGRQVWKVTATGRFDAPRAYGRTLYVGSMDSNFYAIEATTGNIIWKFKTGGAVMNPPAIANNFVYFGSYDGNLYCMGLNGDLVWKFFIGGEQIQARQLSVFGRFSNRFKKLLTFWRPEKPVSRAYEAQTATSVGAGVGAYKSEVSYKSEVGYKSSAPAGYQMSGEKKKKDWRDPWAR